MPKGVYERNQIAGSADEAETSGPAPTTRAREARRERRRRDDGDLDRMGRMALSIPPEVKERLKREGKTARWVRDQSGRQVAMQADDWDISTGVDPVPEARDSEGKLVLMEKFQDWYDEDRTKKASVLDEREEAIRRGQIDGSGKAVESEDNKRLARSNRISRERGL